MDIINGFDEERIQKELTRIFRACTTELGFDAEYESFVRMWDFHHLNDDVTPRRAIDTALNLAAKWCPHLDFEQMTDAEYQELRR